MLSIEDVTAGLKRGPARFIEKLIDYWIGCTSGQVYLCTLTIAKKTHYSRRHVFYGLLDLEDATLVEREQRPNHIRGGLDTNLYHPKGKAAVYVAEQRAQKRAVAAAKAKQRSDATIAYVKRVARSVRASIDPFFTDRYATVAQRASEGINKTRDAREDPKFSAALAEARASLGAADDKVPMSVLWAERRRKERAEST